MATQTLSKPAWVDNLSLLQRKIFEIVGKVITPEHIDLLLDQDALSKYWVRAFTHKSVDASFNYETLEFYGDKIMNYSFAQHIRRRFDDKIDQANGTLLMNQYMSKEFQAELADRLGLPQYVRFDPQFPDVNKHVKEDVVEAFFGCLDSLSNDRIYPGMGAVYCFNLINVIFNDIPIVLENIQKDPITRLKELFEKLGWGKPSYTGKNSDDPNRGEYRVEVRAPTTGDLLGIGYGSRERAEREAAVNALRKLEEQGITLEYADQQKLERQRERNPEFDRQYRRVQIAISKLNDAARRAGKAPVTDFRINNVESHKVPSGYRYTFAIAVAYQGSDGKVAWRNIVQETGDDSDRTKISVMKKFADTYHIPEQV